MNRILIFLFLALFPYITKAAQTKTGPLGDNLTWTYSESTKTLTISGIGEMINLDVQPWEQYIYDIHKIIIDEGVTSIGEWAFLNSQALTSVSIPQSVKVIHDYAFYLCPNLLSITIPQNVTSIGNGVFRYCYRLDSIVVENGNAYYDSRENCNSLIETKTNKLLLGCKNTIIPNSITEIAPSSFSGCIGLTSIIIPESVITIGQMAFSDCI